MHCNQLYKKKSKQPKPEGIQEYCKLYYLSAIYKLVPQSYIAFKSLTYRISCLTLQ